MDVREEARLQLADVIVSSLLPRYTYDIAEYGQRIKHSPDSVLRTHANATVCEVLSEALSELTTETLGHAA